MPQTTSLTSEPFAVGAGWTWRWPLSTSLTTAPFRLPYTLQGYSMVCMRDPVKKSATARLSRIEGQVRGVSRMIAEDRYCIDVMNQIEAVKAALKKLQDEILRDHIEYCVEHAIV